MKQGCAQPPNWQAVMVCWGQKYGTDDINRLAANVLAHCPDVCRLVLLTDRPRDGLLDGIISVDIPQRYLHKDMKGPGCQAKLAIFEQGVIPDDMPAIFFDLDTAIFANIGQLINQMRRPEAVMILQSAILPFGAIARWVSRITKGRKYARGNSSIIVFHPKHCGDITVRFWDLYRKHSGINFRPMIADERFISWVKQDHMQAVPRRIAVKFPTEFMLPGYWLVRLISCLPWVKRRRDNLMAITFCDEICKPERLLDLPLGHVETDHKGRVLIWDNAALGRSRQKIMDYFSNSSPS